MTHFSLRSSAASVLFFKIMFPDCVEAFKMRLGRTKLSYFTTYVIAPFYRKALFEMCSTCSQYVIAFDESLNKIAQRGQMDMSIRFWDSNTNEAVTRYYTSAFLGHATAEVLLEEFLKALSGLDLHKLLQVSMDGPNVNIKFLRLLTSYLKDATDMPELLDFGSCGLHTVHDAFKTSIMAIGWKIASFLRAIFYLFRNVPARRADFIHYTETNKFPLKFCSVR